MKRGFFTTTSTSKDVITLHMANTLGGKHRWKREECPTFGEYLFCVRCGLRKRTKKQLNNACVPPSWGAIRLKTINEIGYALVYLQYIHKGLDERQLRGVKKFAEELHRNINRKSLRYWIDFFRRVDDDTENLC